MNYQQINELLRTSLQNLYYFDDILLQRRVREECINHRLAYYFETLFEQIIHDDMYYAVDLEYNKNISTKNKEIENEDNQFVAIRPDIIIHKRDNNNDNLLAVEAKLLTLSIGDFTKLRKLLRPPYNYRYTAGITYLPTLNYFRYILFRRDNGKVESDTIIVKKQN